MRIGYAPISVDFSAPGDRGRFVGYARARGLEFELAKPEGDYELVVVSAAGDLTRWAQARRGSTKVVYDLPDSYLDLPRDFIDVARGIGKYVFGELSRPVLSYRSAMQQMCRCADAVVCTTEEQKDSIERIATNVHVILDLQDSLIREAKSSYTASSTLNLFWHGLPYTLGGFAVVQGVLRELARKRPVALHVMTSLRFAQWSRRLRLRDTKRVLEGLVDHAFLYEWNELLLSRVATGCDLGVIPLDLTDPLARGKPENKLILMWRMGLPTIASATPSYLRAMDAAGLDMACATDDEWLEKLEAYGSTETARRDAGRQGRDYAEREFATEKILARWDAVLGSLGLA